MGDYHVWLLLLSGVFYGILCIFSIVTGLLYASGRRELNPLELSEKFVATLDTQGKRRHFATKMGWVTFGVGVVQGITAFSILRGSSLICYCIAVGFTLFSICSVLFKLKSKISAFPLMKLVFYAGILAVLIFDQPGVFFWSR